MKLTIKLESQEELQIEADRLGLKLLASLQDICCAIFEQGEREKIREVRVIINPMLLATSYIAVPAMFARSMLKSLAESKYNYIKSLMQDGSLIVIAAETNYPTTFRARIIQGILRHRVFKSSKDLIPKSYRRRPGMIAKIIEEQTGYLLEYETRKSEIVWKVKEDK